MGKLTAESQSTFNLNTILLGITLAALTGVGTISWSNNEKISQVSAAVVPRQEIEAKLEQIRVESRNTDLRIAALAIEIEKLRAKIEMGVGK